MTMYRAEAFARALEKEAGDMVQDAAKDFRDKVGLQVLRGVVQKTPVDTGRARGAWQVTVTNPAAGVIEMQDSSRGPGDGAVIEREADTLFGAPLNEITWITNNVVYIEALEDGHSPQTPPQGMVQVTLAEVESQFR